MDISDAYRLSAADSFDPAALPRLHALFEAPPPHAGTPMRLAIGGAATLFALAVAAALSGWHEGLVYVLAGGALAALGIGIYATAAAARLREQQALAALAGFPLGVLARATVAGELGEATRVKIVNFLNRTHPGWSVDLESADPAWRELRNARGGGGGCGGGCGSRCG